MNEYVTIFLIMLLGYLFGRISIFKLSFGSSGILFVALIFGHFNLMVPEEIKYIGLICFVTAVGIIAGPVFFRNFKKKVTAYIVLGIATIFVGAVVCIVVIKVAGIPTSLALGLMNGALTSTPGLAAAVEATGDTMASVGYGIAYPFGVLGVVIFVQVLPRLLNTDIKAQIRKMEKLTVNTEKKRASTFSIENMGFFPFALAIVLGVLLGNIYIPLPGNVQFKLGMTGGPLLMGLLIGSLGRLGPFSMRTNESTIKSMRELGLALFLIGAGTEAGQGFVEVVGQYGWSLLLYGALITLIPMIIIFFIATKLFKLEEMNSLGMICGGMTSTPALGSLISVAGSDVIAIAYAATYPIALVMVILVSQLIALWF